MSSLVYPLALAVLLARTQRRYTLPVIATALHKAIPADAVAGERGPAQIISSQRGSQCLAVATDVPAHALPVCTAAAPIPIQAVCRVRQGQSRSVISVMF